MQRQLRFVDDENPTRAKLDKGEQNKELLLPG
jgi:hypothetical protein